MRLIEISDTIAVNGIAVTGRELRERVGAGADAILRLSYLDANARRALFGAAAPEGQIRPEAEPALEPGSALSLVLVLLHETTGAQDRLKGMPGYEQYQKVSPQLPGAVRSA